MSTNNLQNRCRRMVFSPHVFTPPLSSAELVRLTCTRSPITRMPYIFRVYSPRITCNKRLWREEICALLFPCVSCVILHVLHIPRLFLLSGTSSVLVRTVLQFNNTSEHVFHRLWKHAC
jgi:hypothetical protein